VTAPSYQLDDEQQEQLQELSSKDVERLRNRAKTSLYFLSKAVLGYDQVEERAHGALCAFMTNEEANRRLVLMPRGHLKTTLCTISDSIRLSLINPNVRVLIQNEVFDNASLMLQELQGHWEKGAFLRQLFPELAPAKFSGPGTDWSKVACSINRTANFKESTYTASGSGGSPQSQHFGYIKNDDLIGEKHKESVAEMDKAKRWVDAMRPLLDRLDDQIDFYGTRKTLSDVYAHIMEVYGEALAVFLREPIENGTPIFSKMPLEELLKIQINTPEVWAYDYANNPIGKGGLDWGQGPLRNYAVSDNGEWYMLQHHLTGEQVRWHKSELDIVITVDPNSGKLHAPDKPAIVAHGCTPEEQILVLETWSERVQPDPFVKQIVQMMLKWRPRVTGIENAGTANALFYCEKEIFDNGYALATPIELKPENRDKESRIRSALDQPLKARRIYVQSHMKSLISQVTLFPQLGVHNWDEIDALAYGPRLYRPGMRLNDMEQEEEAVGKVLQMRGRTGYGSARSHLTRH
jgi:hypothetical protein